jgi:hypothetical protein
MTAKVKKGDPIQKETREIIKAAGGASAVARECNVSRQAVYLWRRIPVPHARIVARLARRALKTIRPDVYGVAA